MALARRLCRGHLVYTAALTILRGAGGCAGSIRQKRNRKQGDMICLRQVTLFPAPPAEPATVSRLIKRVCKDAAAVASQSCRHCTAIPGRSPAVTSTRSSAHTQDRCWQSSGLPPDRIARPLHRWCKPLRKNWPAVRLCCR